MDGFTALDLAKMNDTDDAHAIVAELEALGEAADGSAE